MSESHGWPRRSVGGPGKLPGGLSSAGVIASKPPPRHDLDAIDSATVASGRVRLLDLQANEFAERVAPLLEPVGELEPRGVVVGIPSYFGKELILWGDCVL